MDDFPKMLNIFLAMWNHPIPKKKKMLDIPAGTKMNGGHFCGSWTVGHPGWPTADPENRVLSLSVRRCPFPRPADSGNGLSDQIAPFAGSVSFFAPFFRVKNGEIAPAVFTIICGLLPYYRWPDSFRTRKNHPFSARGNASMYCRCLPSICKTRKM